MELKHTDLEKLQNQEDILVEQNLHEFAEWLNHLSEIKPKLGLEIGTFRFGSAELMLNIFPNLELASMDKLSLFTEKDHATSKTYKGRVAKYGGQLSFLRGASQNINQVRKFMDWIGDRRLDFLFIDGTTQYDGALRDFYTYRSWVRPGGYIAVKGVYKENGIKKLWTELKMPQPVKQDPGPWGNYGIGVGIV
jgi:hypothetical protein